MTLHSLDLSTTEKGTGDATCLLLYEMAKNNAPNPRLPEATCSLTLNKWLPALPSVTKAPEK